MSPTHLPRPVVDARRPRARRTALWVALAAVVVYASFIGLAALSQ